MTEQRDAARLRERRAGLKADQLAGGMVNFWPI